ncbi:small nuclear ribonucleoprotein Sm D-like protein [Myzus persicae]|uniref:small nuclear ribonucleoprotein Sm D-like protein n=1 Tax=Myzus persicae TaxID=13164 RepID=UPI000B937670|nr:small nuclear ribonucleoprotein Sm D-like protein [Myzus persicae]XP_022170042.1 small nuclear ribonucleoprotein Sm D-like protein [Myzus persicae]
MSSSTDEELDMLSPSFNPIKALYAKNVKVPSTTAQPLDNISKFELAPSGEVMIKPERPRTQNEYNIEPIKRDLSSVAGSSQVSSVQRIIKQRRTVLVRMSEIGKSRGPLSRIATFCYLKQRVKVYIRSAVSVRGHCEGYIIAFDKHWNLVMDDVDEVWTRKNKYKSLAIGDARSLDDPVEKPYTVIKRIRGHQVCRRHVPRFLVRGEQIVLVAKCLV